MNNIHRFDNTRVVISGAASGIGTTAARRFLMEGATVAALDLTEEGLRNFASSLDEGSDRLKTIVCDVSDSHSVDSAVQEAVNEFGSIDVVINNAGVGGIGRVGDVSDEDWTKVLAVDLNGVFHVARATLPHLVASKGNMVNTASISGLAGDQAMVAYDTAKGGVVNFTRATAVDYGHDGVRVNAVCPGPVSTPMLNEALDNDEISAQYQQRIPLGRVARPEDIAAAMCFLASEDAAFISGVNLPVDGGLTAWTAQPDISVGLSH